MNTESTQLNSQSDSHDQATQENSGGSEPKRVTLPEPDPDNITVLTNKLPNKPILPWNRYDSPWEEEEGEPRESETKPEEETTSAASPEVTEETEEVDSLAPAAQAPESVIQPESQEPHLKGSTEKEDLDEVDEVE